jgi:hypothetical protein
MLSTVFLKFKAWVFEDSPVSCIFYFSPKFLHLIKTLLTFQVVSRGLKTTRPLFSNERNGCPIIWKLLIGSKLRLGPVWLFGWKQTCM